MNYLIYKELSSFIVLLGYMGCGKSSVARELSRQTSIPFIDLDDFIERSEKLTIKNIFDRHGEIYFRKKERYYLEKLLKSNNYSIVSLGGGTPCYSDNMRFLNSTENVFTIFLQTSPKELAHRLFNERKKRPLISHLNSIEFMEEFISKHLFERMNYYSRAKHKIATNEKSVSQIVKDILTLLT